METIRNIVKTLVFLMLFFAFLEMLLPMKESRRFVQVILGLFIVAAILNPLVALLGKDLSFNLPPAAFLAKEEEVQAILTQGKHLQEVATKVAYEQCREKIEAEVEGIACSVPGVAGADAEVFLLDAGSIEKVFLRIEAEPTDGASSFEEVARQVRHQVASMCGLPSEKVVVSNLVSEEVETSD